MKEPIIQNLRAYVDLLFEEKEIVIVDAEVDPYLEIAEIHRRVIAAGGPALLFTNVKGADFPCATNLFGTAKRVEMAFGKRPEQFIQGIVQLAEEMLPPKFGALWKQRDLLLQGLRVGMKTVKQGPILEHINQPAKLSRLPILTTWPEDGGAFVTLPLVYTEHPENGHHNLGMYRIQRFDEQTMGVHWQIQKGGGFHYWLAEQKNQSLPLTLYIGGPPALILSAIAPMPEDIPELMLATLLQGNKLRRVKNPFGGHPLIAEADFAICGSVPPKERRPEGPFGDHYGYYSLQHDYPFCNVHTVFHRKDAIYPATVVGKPRQEDFFLGDYIQTLLSPLSKLVMPAIHALWSYGETGYHSLTAAVVKERYPREAMTHVFRILGEAAGQLTLTKFLLVLDQPMDLTNFKGVLEYILARTRFETDLFIIANVAMDTLDYAGPAINQGSKGILLGMGDPIRELPAEYHGDIPPLSKSVEVYCKGCLTISGPSYGEQADYGQILADSQALKDWPLVFIVDDTACVQRDITLLWSTFTRFEPAGDIYAANTKVIRHHLVYQAPMIFDCRMKPGYPQEVMVDEKTSKTVSKRWKEYFPNDKVEGVETGIGIPDTVR